MTVERQPWDQRPDEPLESYARFRCFLALGPGRTLALAQRAFGTARKGKKSQSASGVWTDESSRFDWQARAAQWDIGQLTKHGEELAVLWMACLVSIVRKTAQALADPSLIPKTMRDCVATIQAISQHLTPETMRPLLDKLNRSSEPLDSCALDRLDGFKPVIHDRPEDAP